MKYVYLNSEIRDRKPCYSQERQNVFKYFFNLTLNSFYFCQLCQSFIFHKKLMKIHLISQYSYIVGLRDFLKDYICIPIDSPVIEVYAGSETYCRFTYHMHCNYHSSLHPNNIALLYNQNMLCYQGLDYQCHYISSRRHGSPKSHICTNTCNLLEVARKFRNQHTQDETI